KNEKVGKYVVKYMQGSADYPAEHRMRAVRLIENLTMSTGYLVESLHGAGSPQTQKIMISRQAKFKEKMKNAARLAGINFK
ncbi:MAG: 4-hydroxyphenylacetate 3-hydroxylase C-terminal domain-containing protein, partial [Candidatus Jordarchaeales archaeon]